MEDQIDRCLQIESDLLARQIGFGDSLEKNRIPWLISPQAYKFTNNQVDELDTIGQVVKNFLSASIKLYKDHEQIRRLLDLGKPKSILAFQKKALELGQTPRLFRVDLLLMPDDTFKIVEISLKPGGTGITSALQEVYPGNMVGSGLLNCYKRLLDEGNRSILFAVAKEKIRSLTEFGGLSFMLNRDGYRCRFGFPDESTVEQGEVVYNYLPPRTWHQYQSFLNQAINRSAVLVPPTYVFLKEKALFGIFWEKRWQKFWEQELPMGSMTFDLLKSKLIETALFDHRGAFYLNQEAISFNEMLEFSSSQRAKFVVKLSGFNQGSSGAKGVVLGKEVGRSGWQDALRHARQSFADQTGLHVLQPFVPSKKVPVSWLDWESSGIKTEDRYLRVLAYYFNLGGLTKLAGVEVNASDRSKVHLQTDVTSVPGICSKSSSMLSMEAVWAKSRVTGHSVGTSVGLGKPFPGEHGKRDPAIMGVGWSGRDSDDI